MPRRIPDMLVVDICVNPGGLNGSRPGSQNSLYIVPSLQGGTNQTGFREDDIHAQQSSGKAVRR